MKTDRRAGLEQEFLLVDPEGRVSDGADAFLRSCREVAREAGADASVFSGECTFGMVEVRSGPHRDFASLREEYLTNLGLAVRAGREVGLRLYPLGTYPLPLTPRFRPEDRYRAQLRTLGEERFMPAGKCIGVHLHVEIPPGVVDREEVISQSAPLEGLSELVRVYNLMTALDPALISLTRSCPYYEGRMTELAARTAFYRGSRKFGWEGVYTELPELGGLHPYAGNAEELVDRQLEGKEAWLRAMRRAGTDRELKAMSKSILDLCWRPVRVSQQNTVEVRSLDGNLPRVVLGTVALVRALAGRLVAEGLSVEPEPGVRTLVQDGSRLLVPSFDLVGGELLYEAATSGASGEAMRPYLDSVFELAGEVVRAGSPEGRAIAELRDESDGYRTTDAEILERWGATTLGTEEGLALVREACDRLEGELAEEVPGLSAPA